MTRDKLLARLHDVRDNAANVAADVAAECEVARIQLSAAALGVGAVLEKPFSSDELSPWSGA
jgi:hypothetical protein